MSVLVLAAALFAAPVSDAAVERRMSAQYKQCVPLAGDDMARLTCVLTELQMQNNAMNAEIVAKGAAMGKVRGRAFQKQQYTWFYARNRQCLRVSRQGPTPIFAQELKCRLSETIRHRIELEGTR